MQYGEVVFEKVQGRAIAVNSRRYGRMLSVHFWREITDYNMEHTHQQIFLYLYTEVLIGLTPAFDLILCSERGNSKPFSEPTANPFR